MINFTREIAYIIAEYAVPMHITSWIEPEMITRRHLLANPNAIGAEIDVRFGGNIDLDKECWSNVDFILRNPSPVVGEWFMQNFGRFGISEYMGAIAGNPSEWAGSVMSGLIARNPFWMDYIDWDALASNPASWATDLLREHPSEIDTHICSNPSEYAIRYIQEPIDADDNSWLIYFKELSRNPHPWAIQYVDKNCARNEEETFANPNPDLIEFIRASILQGKSNPDALAENPNIFEQDEFEVLAVCDVLYGC